MCGYNGTPNIWAQTKHFLKTELEKESKDNPDARIVVIPFQQVVLSPEFVDPRNINWQKIEHTLDDAVSNITDTNICDAWLSAERYIDRACENYIGLLTDGRDNIGGASKESERKDYLNNILEQFCGKYTNTKGFYVELTKNDKLPANIRQTLDVCTDLYLINAEDGIPSFGCIVTDIIEVNTRDLPVDIALSFSNAGDFGIQALNTENEYVTISVVDNKIKSGELVLRIESKFGDKLSIINEAIGDVSDDIDFTIFSDDVTITSPNLELRLHTTPIRSLDITDNIQADVERVKPFVLINTNVYDTICWNLQHVFSQQAINDHSMVPFAISSKNGLNGCSLLYNGSELADKYYYS